MNRLELGTPGAAAEHRYQKIVAVPEALDRLLVDVFLESHRQPPSVLWLDLDATDDPLHGHQEGRFFHGYYKAYCYLPLYIFCGEHLLCARLRPANNDAAAGSVTELARIIGQIRQRWPDVRINIRGDSGFCREEIMGWCEANGVGYLLGLARNQRLEKRIAKALRKSRRRHVQTGLAARRFRELRYRTRESWSRTRRVVAKAEYLAKGANPRFVVTNLDAKTVGAQALYDGGGVGVKGGVLAAHGRPVHGQALGLGESAEVFRDLLKGQAEGARLRALPWAKAQQRHLFPHRRRHVFGFDVIQHGATSRGLSTLNAATGRNASAPSGAAAGRRAGRAHCGLTQSPQRPAL